MTSVEQKQVATPFLQVKRTFQELRVLMKSKSSDVFHLPTTACGGTQNIGQRRFTSLCNQGILLLDTKNLNSQKISLGSRSFHPTPDLFSEKEWHQNDHEMLHGT